MHMLLQVPVHQNECYRGTEDYGCGENEESDSRSAEDEDIRAQLSTLLVTLGESPLENRRMSVMSYAEDR